MRARHAETYVVPLLGVTAATLVKLVFPELFGREVPFLLYWLVIAGSGWRYGSAGTWTAVGASALCAWYFFLPPVPGWHPPTVTTTTRLLGFMVEGWLIALVVAQAREADQRAEQTGEERRSVLERDRMTRQRLETLASVAVELSKAHSRQRVAEILVEHGMGAVHADTCMVYVYDAAQDELELLAQAGVSAELLERLGRVRGVASHPWMVSLRTGQALWVESEAEYAELLPEIARLPTARAKAFWIAPLIVEGSPAGLLGMGFHTPRRFDAEDREFALTLSLHCAQAMRRAELFEREQAARHAAERAQLSLEITLRSIGDGVIATDADARVVLMNPVAEALTGFSETEALGRPLGSVFRIVDEDTRRELEDPAARALRDGAVVELGHHALLLGKQPGRETSIDDSAAPIRTPDGQIAGVVLVFRDVSREKRLEAQREFIADATSKLMASLDYQTTLAQIATSAVPKLADWCAIDMVDPETGKIQRLAQAHVDPAKVTLAKELGLKYPPDPDAAVGVPHVIRSGRSEFYPELHATLLEQYARDAEHLSLLRELQLRSALVVPIAARDQVFGAITLVQADSGRRYTTDDLAFAEDFARRAGSAVDNARLFLLEQESRAQADAASRAKDEFLATVSHELRTPLNAILGWARLLNREGVDPSKQRRGLEAVERNAQAMTSLIEDLLDVSRIVSGRLRLDFGPVELEPVIDAALDSVRPSAAARRIQLARRVQPGVPPVSGDAGRLQQVVWNLLSNAVKFTEPGGHVAIRLRRLDSIAEIEVEDDGRGIEARFLSQLFTPFRQADSSITRSHGGLGLGLSITKHLVDLHHGSITAHSDGPGRGAKFVVRLPLAEAAADQPHRRSAQSQARGASEELPSLSGLHVLVVDDDPDARELLRSLLEDRGCRVSSADGVPAALALLQGDVPDLMISDIGMPGENGYDLIRKLRALPDPRARSIPALALTAYARSEDRWRVLRAGYLMHIPKPLEPAELVSAVANLARQARAQAEG